MQLLKPVWVAQDGHPIFSLDIHPSGKRFATGGQGESNGRVCIWNMAPVLSAKDAEDEAVPKLLSQMDHHLGCVNCLRWSPSGTFLATGGDDKLVMVWKQSSYGTGSTVFGGGGKVNHESWRCVNTLRSHSGDIVDLAWSQGDKLLATASVDNTVIVWNAEKLPEMVTTLTGHSGLVKGVVFDPVGKYLATQSDDKTLRVWKTSNWKEEACITKPFAESGATTHCLRPGWSPDGSMIVSAHAMNEGGPTAQIIDRETWGTEKDFVGHKKAITCVRFNQNLFEKTKAGEKTPQMFVTVALGSRDRSFSVWCTHLKRPYFVISDAFDQSVQDVSWSRDGKILMACSMDGTVACCILSDEELGKKIPESKVHDLMKKQYGKSYGVPAVPVKQTNGATLVLENPELLKKANKMKPSTSKAAVAAAAPQRPRGPTDKQIEARTSDGKRRITPIFIPPDEASKDAQSFGQDEFKSVSSKEKSSIEVEKREGIVKPNISPGKSGSNSQLSSKDSESSNQEKTKKEEPKKEEEEKVNVIQVKRKPKRIVDSSEDEGEKEKVNTIPIRRTKDEGEKEKVNTIPIRRTKEKPEVQSNKRKSNETEENRPRKRGRPILVRAKENSDDEQPRLEATPTKSPIIARSEPTTTTTTIKLKTVSSEVSSNAVLPPALIEKSRNCAFVVAGTKINVQVHNGFKEVGNSMKVHMVRFVEGEKKHQVLFPSPVNTVSVCAEQVVLTTLDASLHVFSPEGERLFPPLMLPASVSKIVASNDQLAAVTTSGRFFLWRFAKGKAPKIVQRNECVLSLLNKVYSDDDEEEDEKDVVTIAKIQLTEDRPVIVTSSGKSYVFDADVGTWVKLWDSESSIKAVSNYANSKAQGVPSTDNKRLTLSNLSLDVRSASCLDDVPHSVRNLANISHCELQQAAAMYLNSPREYKHWLLCLANHLCDEAEGGNDKKLRNLLDLLLGPKHAADSAKASNWEPKILDLDKHDLLKDSLKLVGERVSLQRLYMEYQEQINAGSSVDTDMTDMNDLFNK